MTTLAPKIIVAVYLRGDLLKPESVSQVLGVKPSRFQEKGELRITSTNRSFHTKVGLWGLISQSDSSAISDHIDELVSKLGNPVIPLKEIDGVQEAYLDIFMAIASDDEAEKTVDFELSSEQMEKLNRLGLPVRVTITVGKE